MTLNSRLVFYTVGNLLICLAGAMLIPLVLAVYYEATAGDEDFGAFACASTITLVVGVGLRLTTKTKQGLGNKEGAAIVALS